MDLEDALAQTKSAVLRAEAEGFDSTADALRILAIEIERLRASVVEKRPQTEDFDTSIVYARPQ